MVKPFVSRGLRVARILLVPVMCIGALGVPVCKLSDSIEPMRALGAHHDNPSEATRQAMEDAFARDHQRRTACMSGSASIFLIAAVGIFFITLSLRGTPTI